jgi:F-type H+-transporting ATPase subunit b
MQIDWFTWGAQIVNFLILVAVLKHFLYGRILRAIDERDQELQDRWDQADQATSTVEQERQALEERQQAWDAEQEAQLQEAREHAERKRKALIEETRQEVEQTRRQWLEALGRDRDALADDLQKVAGEEVLATARQVLQDLAEVSLEHQVMQVFTQRLTEAGGPDDETSWLQGLDLDKDSPVRVTSTFSISEEDRDRLSAVIRQQRSRRQAVEFKRSDDSIYGVAVQAGSERWGWTVADYLDQLRERFHNAIRDAARAAHHTAAAEKEDARAEGAESSAPDKDSEERASDEGEADHD